MVDDKAVQITDQLAAQRQKVDVDNFDITIKEIVRMAVDGELIRAPDYQRKFRWGKEDQSRLIESLFLGLPVPSIFVATNKDSTWDLVDGLQRVSSLMHFIAEPPSALKQLEKETPLKLHGLEKLSHFNGMTFSELPPNVRLTFFKRPLRVTALSDKSDYSVRFDMFERLNKGGVSLSEQEVRACIYRGPYLEFIDELATDPGFSSLLKLKSVNQSDGTKEELVLKFFAYLNYRNKFKGSVKNFLNEYAELAKDEFDKETDRKLFIDVSMKLAEIIDGPFLRPKVKVTPLNQLEAVMVALGELIRSNSKVEMPGEDWLRDKILVKHSTKGTNAKSALEGRISRAKQLLSGETPDLDE